MSDDGPSLEDIQAQVSAAHRETSVRAVASLDDLLRPTNDPRLGSEMQPYGNAVYGAAETTQLDATLSGAVVTGDGFGPGWRRFIQSGVFNGDFAAPPPDPSIDVSDTNAVPGWTIVAGGAGSITLRSVVDSGSASGRVMRCTLASTPNNGEKYIQQIVPVLSSRARAMVYTLRWSAKTALARDTQILFRVAAFTWLDTAGAVISAAFSTFSTSGVSTVHTTTTVAEAAAIAPANAAYLLIQIGFKNVSGGSLSGTVDITDAQVVPGTTAVNVADVEAGVSSADLRLAGGLLTMGATIAAGGATDAIQLDPANDVIWFFLNSGGFVKFTPGAGAATKVQIDAHAIVDTSTGLKLDAPLVLANGVSITDATGGRLQASSDIRPATGLIITKSKAGSASDSDFDGTAANGGLLVDITNSRIWARVSGTWKFVAVAGFAVPADERHCPECLRRLEVGDEVVGILNEWQEGALHGFYKHRNCGLAWRLLKALGLVRSHLAEVTARLHAEDAYREEAQS